MKRIATKNAALVVVCAAVGFCGGMAALYLHEPRGRVASVSSSSMAASNSEPLASSAPYGDPVAVATAMSAFAKSVAMPTVASAPPSMPPHPSAEDRAETLAREADAHAGRLAKHGREERDMSWAPLMEERIGDAVRTYAGPSVKGHFEGVDCRSQTCVASFSWSSRDEALGELRRTMQRIGQQPCSTALTMPQTDPGSSGPYVASIYMDCGAARFAGQLPAPLNGVNEALR
jgi:hypothetical protein